MSTKKVPRIFYFQDEELQQEFLGIYPEIKDLTSDNFVSDETVFWITDQVEKGLVVDQRSGLCQVGYQDFPELLKVLRDTFTSIKNGVDIKISLEFFMDLITVNKNIVH